MGYNHMGYNHSCFRRSKSQISHRMEKGPSTIGRFPSWDGTILRQKKSAQGAGEKNIPIWQWKCGEKTVHVSTAKNVFFCWSWYILVHSFRRHKLGFSENPKNRRHGKTDSPHPKITIEWSLNPTACPVTGYPTGWSTTRVSVGFFDQQVSDYPLVN